MGFPEADNKLHFQIEQIVTNGMGFVDPQVHESEDMFGLHEHLAKLDHHVQRTPDSIWRGVNEYWSFRSYAGDLRNRLIVSLGLDLEKHIFIVDADHLNKIIDRDIDSHQMMSSTLDPRNHYGLNKNPSYHPKDRTFYLPALRSLTRR